MADSTFEDFTFYKHEPRAPQAMPSALKKPTDEQLNEIDRLRGFRSDDYPANQLAAARLIERLSTA